MDRLFLTAMLFLACNTARAGDDGSPQQARAMLQRAVAAVQANEPAALAAFIKGEAGFKDRDLYVFCARTNGTMDAHPDPSLMGRNIKDLYDLDGVAFGQEMLAVAQPGTMEAISYLWPKPGSHTPTPKVTYVTKVADQICAVGYYK